MMPRMFYYKAMIDVAQYALHQGNSRWGNLIEGFVPLGKFTFRHVLFLDLRYYNPNGTPREWNADLAFRLLPSANSLWGIYGGYDRLQSDSTRYFNEIHGGMEFWLYKFFFGADGYLPVGKKEYNNTELLGGDYVPTAISYRYNIAYAGQYNERLLPGGNAEIGLNITHGLTIYAGGYYFHHSGFNTISGPKFRATYTFYCSNTHRLFGLFDRVRFEGLITHDKPRGTSWLLGARFTFGLTKYPNQFFGVLRYMPDPIPQ
jgi:hypothetical protein